MSIVARISFTAAAETRVFEIFSGQITAQSSAADVDLYGSNMPTDASSWQSIGTVVGGYAPTSISTGLSHIKAVAAGPTIFAASDIDQAGTGGGGGGGGGAVTIADGADVAQGARAQTAATDDTGTWSLVQLTKRGLQRISTILDRLPALVSGRMPVDGSSVTQPVSASALPLPSGASTAAKQDTLNARMSRMGGLAMTETEEVGSTVYVLHRSSIDSAMSYVVVRYVTTGGAVAIRYAGTANNPTMTTSALAWTNRATLTYGSLAEA